jgi:hypothetical protein
MILRVEFDDDSFVKFQVQLTMVDIYLEFSEIKFILCMYLRLQ